MKRSSLFLGLAVFFLCTHFSTALTAAADGEETPWKRLNFNLGGAYNLTDSRVQLGVKSVGISIDMEELLDLIFLKTKVWL